MLTTESTMKIQVNRVPSEGLEERVSYNPKILDADRVDVHPQEPFEMNAVINIVDSELVVQAKISCALKLICGRCLEEFMQTVSPKAIFSYTVGPTDVVDITDDVRQELMLAYPIIPICRKDCKGLCRLCGQNLNKATCDHQEVQK